MLNVMRTVCSFLFLILPFLLPAQIRWTDGTNFFVSKKVENDYYMKNPKLKQGFVLRSIDNSGHVFVMENSGSPSFTMPFSLDGGLVSLSSEQDGFSGSFLCLTFNDKNGDMVGVYQNFKNSIKDFCETNIHWLLTGTYNNENNDLVIIRNGSFFRNKETHYYSICQAKGVPTNVIRLDDGSLMMFCVSTTGFNVYEASSDTTDSSFVKGKLIEKLRASERDGLGYLGRWGCVTQFHLLNRGFLEWFDNDMLRLMRNEIFARNGHVFHTPDLRVYFDNRLWYFNLEKKKNVVLTGLDLFNANLIKMVENEQNRSVAPTEPGY